MSLDADNPTARILVIDDNAANRALAQSTLEDEGYEVILAAGGAEGIAAFERERPECVLLDVRMPGVDGFTVCRQIRAMPHGAETPILFFTALRDVDTFDTALRAGGTDFLTKPIRPAELVVRVQTALKVRRLDAAVRTHYEMFKRSHNDLLRLQIQKERLIAFVVHDLKGPVNVMDLHAQVLLRERGLPPTALESAASIRTEARQLNRMIMDLLDLAKADEGQLLPRRVEIDLPRLVDAVTEELSVSALGRNVALKSSVETPRHQGDEDLLRRMLTNLVENAIRHSPPESAITVTVRRVESAIELRVSDAGTGIPLELREKIFDPFVQVDSGERVVARGGRGLGLTFCKLAVEAHGGRIWVEDAAPGAVFCVSLPE